MKIKPQIYLLAALLCIPHPALARRGGKKRPPPIHYSTVIERVSGDYITIRTINAKQDAVHTYKIVSGTEITFNGETVTAASLQAGERVDVTPDAVDPTTAGEIMASDPPKETPKKKK